MPPAAPYQRRLIPLRECEAFPGGANGTPARSQDLVGRGGCTAVRRAARSKAQGQHDLSGGCVRRASGLQGGALNDFWLLFFTEKYPPAGQAYKQKPFIKLCDADRRNITISIVSPVNPSVSLTATSSPYTRETMGWGEMGLAGKRKNSPYGELFLCTLILPAVPPWGGSPGRRESAGYRPGGH